MLKTFSQRDKLKIIPRISVESVKVLNMRRKIVQTNHKTFDVGSVSYAPGNRELEGDKLSRLVPQSVDLGSKFFLFLLRYCSGTIDTK